MPIRILKHRWSFSSPRLNDLSNDGLLINNLKNQHLLEEKEKLILDINQDNEIKSNEINKIKED
jgi:hypothetical protein